MLSVCVCVWGDIKTQLKASKKDLLSCFPPLIVFPAWCLMPSFKLFCPIKCLHSSALSHVPGETWFWLLTSLLICFCVLTGIHTEERATCISPVVKASCTHSHIRPHTQRNICTDTHILAKARSHTCKPTRTASWHLGELKIVKQVDWRSNWEEMVRPS